MSHPGKGGEYLSAAEAIRLLGVKAQTLYAYASRHLIRTIPHGNKRLKLYSREDVEHLRERGHARSGKRFTASGGLRWGEPIVHTAITEITDAGPKYRNRLATDLARSNCSFESVAELLWSGIPVDEHICWNRPPPALDPDRLINALGALRSDVQLIHAFLILALTTGIAPHNRDEIRQGTTTLVARDLISSLPGCFGYIAKRRSYHTCRPSTGVAESLARALGMSEDEEVVSALNAALILVADHEMTPPTFSARVAASSGSDLCSCIVSAICTHSGTRVRRACDKVEELFDWPLTPAAFRKRLRALQKSGASPPGFNHPLYPRGDPRARHLIEVAKSLQQQTKQSERIYAVLDQLASESQTLPGLEVGLVTLCSALGMPKQSAAGLLTLGRVAGWIAHVLEQRLAGIMLRPRARYLRLE